MKNPKLIGTAIGKAKRTLIARVAKKGIYENFGEKEYRKIQDDYIEPYSNTDVQKVAQNKFKTFYDWCLDYNGWKPHSKPF